MTSDYPSGNGEAQRAIEVLRGLDETSELQPHVLEFAHFLADRIEGDMTNPLDFVLVSALAIYDLERGKDGYTQAPIKSGAAGLDKLAYLDMTESIPALAAMAFSGTFGADVKEQMQQAGMLSLVSESDEQQRFNEGEIIDSSVNTIAEARELIINNAQNRVAALNWDHFGISPEEASTGFSATFPIILRNASLKPPLTTLIDKPGAEAGLLAEMFDEYKEHIVDKFWLAITSEITPELATVIRDHLILMSLETIALLNQKDPKEVVDYFRSQDDGTLERAGWRLANYVVENQLI